MVQTPAALNAALTGRLVKSVAGGADVTLTTAEASNLFIELTGTLTANINLIMPAGVRHNFILNNTSGAYAITVKTAAGTGVAVMQGKRVLLECDGTNVVNAFTSAAADVTNTPAGNIAATDVQAAINELDTDKAARAGHPSQAFEMSSGSSVSGSGNVLPSVRTSTANAVGWDYWQSGATAWQQGAGTGDGSGNFNLYSSSGTPGIRMAVTPSGNVGIGTASPNANARLTLSGGGLNLASSQSTELGINEVGWIWHASGPTVLYRGNNPFIIKGNTGGSFLNNLRIDPAGNIGIGCEPSYQLHVDTDSAGKPGTGGLWTVVSDERIKTDIVDADLSRCYEIVKQVPLKHFGFAPGVYSAEQVSDKHNLGWIAQDVQKVFKNAVSIKPFTLYPDIPDGEEEYEEREFTVEMVDEITTAIEVLDGKGGFVL